MRHTELTARYPCPETVDHADLYQHTKINKVIRQQFEHFQIAVTDADGIYGSGMQ